MAVHTGRPFVQAGDYFGPPVNRAARLLGAAHGGQVLLSEDTLSLVENRLDPDVRVVDLGYHRLKDLDAPVRIFHAVHPAIETSSFPPPRSLNGVANNLPVQRTSFIGREKEIEQIAAALARDEPSLLALTGPGGIGKTRLSLQAAAERVELFPDGVWLVRLSDAVDARGAAIEVASTVGIPLPSGANPVEAVRTWLADRRCLLILDDCGHVPEAGRFICELLSGSASLRCLATSRESLRLEQGAELEVPELTRPAPDANAAALLESEAGRLFVDRAHEERADFALNDRRARPIARLLSRLPGLPEAVERAAAMLRQQDVSPGQVLAALGRELRSSMEGVGQIATEQGREIVLRLKDAPSLGALLETAIQANQGYADHYGVSLALTRRQAPAWVEANFDRLMQVMANLLSNAAKFSPRGARVEVRLEQTQGAVRVSVVDPGPGIPDDFKPRVFDRFAQADSTTTRHRGGTGLGLAICKMIMDKLGGKIDFESTAGQGTTFYFELPPHAQVSQAYAQERGALRT